jgi:head-tail adaptor
MIGNLRNEITLLSPSRIADSGGGAGLVWSPDGAAIWADVRLLSSTTDVAGDRARRLKRLSARVRPRDGLAPGARLRYDGVDFEIVSIEDADARGRRILLICEEIAS